MGEATKGPLRLDFNRCLKLEFRGATITSDAGLLAFRELDDALGLTKLAASWLTECRLGKNTQHALVALLRQSIFGRLAGYEDVNDAERLRLDPAMRSLVDHGDAPAICGIHQRDGPLRDRTTGDRGEPRSST